MKKSIPKPPTPPLSRIVSNGTPISDLTAALIAAAIVSPMILMVILKVVITWHG